MNHHKCVFLGLMAMVAPALPCTCVSALHANAKTMMDDHAVVFRGTVLERRVLPQRAEMRGRHRYSITFQVNEYWKGSPEHTRTVYGVDEGTDCMGGSSFELGKNYLVYADEQVAHDEILDDGFFWFGWTDVLPGRTGMLVPGACAPSGETTTAETRRAFRELGKGRAVHTIKR